MPPVATDPSPDLTLAPLKGEPQPIRAWLTTFPLVAVVLDPYTHESAWILETAGRILRVYDQADCRVSFITTCDAEDARRFLGPWATEVLTFTDPDRALVKGLGLERLPALVHIRQDLTLAGAAEGWEPEEWREVLSDLSRITSWYRPTVPAAGDPAPYAGSPALG